MQSKVCGHGVIELEIGEICDGNKFGNLSRSCVAYNQNSFISGNLSCVNCNIDTSSCTEVPSCGNGVINAGESCDSTNFGALDKTCANYSNRFTSGNLACTNCQIDASSCQGATGGSCGDHIINNGEECDTNQFGSIKQCSDYNEFIGGTLSCRNCQLNTSGCIEKGCGNNFIESGEQCAKQCNAI